MEDLPLRSFPEQPSDIVHAPRDKFIPGIHHDDIEAFLGDLLNNAAAHIAGAHNTNLTDFTHVASFDAYAICGYGR
jgi:hypothetical protein